MDLIFTRNQIEMKLMELNQLFNIYIDGVENQMLPIQSLLEKKETTELKRNISQIKETRDLIKENGREFELLVIELQTLYSTKMTQVKLILEEHEKNRTLTFEGITIIRNSLAYSLLAQSIGYDHETRTMDIEFTQGTVYRYYDVPLDYYQTVLSRNNLKGFKEEIAQFKFIKIQ